MSEHELENTGQLDLLSEVLPDVIAAFRKLNDEGREKLFKTIATLFSLGADATAPSTTPTPALDRFSKDRPISPKEFLAQKQPRNDVERVACLAYYLTHFREQAYFKSLEISKLNTEAAQVKFPNAATVVNNAATLGYLVSATKGNKQISAAGERFVEVLPDREAARAAMADARVRRRSRRASGKKAKRKRVQAIETP